MRKPLNMILNQGDSMAGKQDSNNSPKTARIKYPEKFTASSIASYLAQKNNISLKQAKAIIEDLFDVINAGVMSGERVPMGKFGKIHVRVRPATKARKGRNPLTGEEMTIPAKKATKVPKFTFTKNFKEEVVKAKTKK